MNFRIDRLNSVCQFIANGSSNLGKSDSANISGVLIYHFSVI